ncbi:hypothetical protein ACB094_10G158000 [Castanea mollissima]
MSGQTPPSNPTTDAYQYLQIVNNSDGTITRHRKIPNTPATPDPDHPTPVLSKDIPLNQSNKTWVRIFLPKQVLHNPSTSKLPLIVYFHGGGFIIYSAASTVFHDFCSTIAIDVNAIIVSVDYRLAPEHRLPAAYDDAYADFSNTYIMGSSAGGNVAYHAALREADQIENLEPLIIKGLILHQPYFGGTQRTESELRLANDPVLPLPLFVNDLIWELSLPIGVDRDHEYCNPTVGGGSQRLEKIRLLGWRVLVIDCKGDSLIDRQIELVKMMEEKGVVVVSQFDQGGHHGVDLGDLSRAKALNVVLKNFMLHS